MILFQNKPAATNDAFKKVLKKRNAYYTGLSILGLLTLALTLYAEFNASVAISDYMLGVYCGCGAAFTIIGIVKIIRNRKIMGNDEKLKTERLKSSDERILAISSKAYRLAAFVLIIALYAVSLIGGLFYPILVNLLLLLIAIFCGVYFVAYKYFEHRM